MADSFEEDSFEEDAPSAGAPGEPGQPGPNQYDPATPPMTAGGKSLPPGKLKGSPLDAAKTWANTAALGAGPQIAGAMGALMAGMQPSDSPAARDRAISDAYREVRNDTAKDLAKSEDTGWGGAAVPIGMLSTPIPVKGLGPGASAADKALHGVKVGAGIGAIHGAVNSDADLTKDDGWQKYAELLKDTAVGGIGGGLAGGATGGLLGAIEKPARSVARRLPMDMLGVGEAARRSMQRQGIYDEAGDELLKLVRPLRSGMRKGTLTEDAIAEANRRGGNLRDTIAAIDEAAPGGVTSTDAMRDATTDRASPYARGSVQDKQVARRMSKEADNMMTNHGELLPDVGAPMSLAEAEAYKQRFGPAVAKQLRHAGEPAAKTDALAETYRALRSSNEAAANAVDPALGADFVGAKKAYQQIAAPLEGANVERSGLQSSDFDWGSALSAPPPPPNALTKMIESVPLAGPLLTGGLNLAGRAYGRGVGANLAEFLANRAANNTGGGVGGISGDALSSKALDKLAPWTKFLGNDEEQPQ